MYSELSDLLWPMLIHPSIDVGPPSLVSVIGALIFHDKRSEEKDDMFWGLKAPPSSEFVLGSDWTARLATQIRITFISLLLLSNITSNHCQHKP